MTKTTTMPDLSQPDAELVAQSLAGNREAFGNIVSRHQTLLCSLAYCATGNLSQSEDLAQETFCTAWKDLAKLREPAKLRSWLCAMMRFRLSHQYRRQERDPIYAAASLQEAATTAAPELPPSLQAMTNEETALLWRSLADIPELYREPLVLFYREQQSIAAVAVELELSEDAVKQRLSRGRKLLQEQVLAFVEGALARTNPGQLFTLGVLAALPAMTISAKAATLSAAAKGGFAAKGAGWLGMGAVPVAGALLAPLLAFYSMWSDYRVKRKEGLPARELKLLKRRYFLVAGSVGVFSLLCIWLMDRGGKIIKTNPALFGGLMIGLIWGYFLIIALFFWRYVRAAKKLAVEEDPADISPDSVKIMLEYRSRFKLLGWPVIHIRFRDWHGRRTADRSKGFQPLKAWIAVSDGFAIGGLFAYGGFALAPISMGSMTIGLFSFGAFSLGVLAWGGFAFGIWALGPFAAGWQAFGACAIAWKAAWGGQYAVAHYFALGETARALHSNTALARIWMNANPFFQFCHAHISDARLIAIIWVWLIPTMIFSVIPNCIAAGRAKKEPIK